MVQETLNYDIRQMVAGILEYLIVYSVNLELGLAVPLIITFVTIITHTMDTTTRTDRIDTKHTGALLRRL